MRITGIEARRYSLPLDPPFDAAWDPRSRTEFGETIVIVDTDDGVRGYGGGAPVPDLELLGSLLIGVDASNSGRIFDICHSVDFHGGRNWTVEVAIRDALARAAGVPLWESLGGNRSSFRAYASTGERLPARARVERSLAWREHGICALKIRFGRGDWLGDVALVAAVREAVGESMDIMVDANNGWRMPGDLAPPWTLEDALTVASALADLGVYWLEEPLPTEDVGDYVELRRRAGVRIAAGEMVRSLAETRQLVFSGAVDVVQNDVVLAGGIEGASRLAGWSRDAGIVWSPHTWTTGLGLLANLHAALAFSGSDYIEVPYDPPGWSVQRRDFMLPEPLEIDGTGMISVPEGPGLGVVPDLAAMESYRVG